MGLISLDNDVTWSGSTTIKCGCLWYEGTISPVSTMVKARVTDGKAWFLAEKTMDFYDVKLRNKLVAAVKCWR